MTPQQQSQQSDGPNRPTVRQLQLMLARIPAHVEIRAVSINGQASVTVVESYHEGLEQVHVFKTNDYYDVKP
jgi:hypothetical protein